MSNKVVFILSIIVSISVLISINLGYAYYKVAKIPGYTPKSYLRTIPNKDKTVICFVGDSITQGSIGENYINILAKQLGDQKYEYINAGINGELAWHVTKRLDEIKQCKPDIITILIGTNDAGLSLSSDSLEYAKNELGLPAKPDMEWFRKNLLIIIDRLKRGTNAHIAVLSLPTIGENPNDFAYRQSGYYSQIIKSVAKDENIAYLPLHEKMHEYFLSKPGKSVDMKKQKTNMNKAIVGRYLWGKDNQKISESRGYDLHIGALHLNKAGAQMVANLLGKYIKKLPRHQ